MYVRKNIFIPFLPSLPSPTQASSSQDSRDGCTTSQAAGRVAQRTFGQVSQPPAERTENIGIPMASNSNMRMKDDEVTNLYNAELQFMLPTLYWNP